MIQVQSPVISCNESYVSCNSDSGDNLNELSGDRVDCFKHIVSIAYQNVRGLRTKTKEFYESSVNQEHDIIALTETWLAEDIHDSELFDSEQYTIFRQDRDTEITGKNRGGGCLLGVSNKYTAQMLEDWNFNRPEIENIWVKINLDHLTIFVCVIYLPPPVNNLALEALNECLETVASQLKNQNIIILGDMNIPNFYQTLKTNGIEHTETYLTRSLNNMLSYLSLVSLNNVVNKLGNTLDLVLFHCKRSPDLKRGIHVLVQKGDPLVKEDEYHPTLNIFLGYKKNRNKNRKNNTTSKFIQVTNRI